MAQTAGERKEAILQLEQLIPLYKWTKCDTKHRDNAQTKLEDIAKPRPEY